MSSLVADDLEFSQMSKIKFEENKSFRLKLNDQNVFNPSQSDEGQIIQSKVKHQLKNS